MKKIKNIVVFNSQVKHGQMNTNKDFYPGLEDNLEERVRLMREHKQALANEVGFHVNHIFMALQRNNNHPYIPGTCYTVTPDDYVEYSDLYYYDVWADSVKLTRKTPGVVIGFNVGDSANVIAFNRKTLDITSTYCSGEHINHGVPFTIAATLGGNPEDIIVDISPFAYLFPFLTGKLSEPSWVSNQVVWEGCLKKSEKVEGILWINQKEALIRQLLASGILEENITIRENTLQNPNYYSMQRARLQNDPSQGGRFMHGVMYEMEGQEREYQQTYIKRYSVER